MYVMDISTPPAAHGREILSLTRSAPAPCLGRDVHQFFVRRIERISADIHQRVLDFVAGQALRSALSRCARNRWICESLAFGPTRRRTHPESLSMNR